MNQILRHLGLLGAIALFCYLLFPLGPSGGLRLNPLCCVFPGFPLKMISHFFSFKFSVHLWRLGSDFGTFVLSSWPCPFESPLLGGHRPHLNLLLRLFLSLHVGHRCLLPNRCWFFCCQLLDTFFGVCLELAWRFSSWQIRCCLASFDVFLNLLLPHHMMSCGAALFCSFQPFGTAPLGFSCPLRDWESCWIE